MVSERSSLVIMPLVGRIADRIDKFTLYAIASVWRMIMVVIYTNMTVTSQWLVMIVNELMMMGILSRMMPGVALTTAIPDLADRGAFMSINSSLQQIAGGVAAAAAGMIVQQKPSSVRSTLQQRWLCNGVYFFIDRVPSLWCKCDGKEKTGREEGIRNSFVGSALVRRFYIVEFSLRNRRGIHLYW
jgi:MFS family permease